jgi:hypothetical protein
MAERLKGLVVENLEDQSQVDEAIHSCTNGMAKILIENMTDRYKLWRDQGRFSMQYMHRHLFLAYRMAHAHARAGKCEYTYAVRVRPDVILDNTLSDWPMVEKKLEDAPLLVGTRKQLFQMRSGGVNVSDRCMVDDVFAIGTMEAMGSYSSMFPDFQDFVRFLPFSRPDLNGYTNERFLTAHLHYRGVKFAEFPIDWNLHTCLRVSDIKFC